MKAQTLSSSPGMAQEASMSTSASKAHQRQQRKVRANGPLDLCPWGHKGDNDLATRVTTWAAQTVWTQAKQWLGPSEAQGKHMHHFCAPKSCTERWTLQQIELLQLPINWSSKQIQSLYEHNDRDLNIISRIMADSLLATAQLSKDFGSLYI